MASTFTRRRSHPASAARSSKGSRPCVSCRFAAETRTARTKPNEQVRRWRLMPLTFLLPSTPRSPFCGPEVTLCESTIPVDGAGALPSAARAYPGPGRRPRGLAEPRPGRRGQEGGDVRPDAVAAEAVPVAAHGLPRAEVLGQRSPAAALGPEVKTAVDHRTDVLGQGRVGLEQGSDQLPFRVRQVARVASAIILVPLTILHRPHPPPPSLLTTELGAAR